MTTPKTNGNDDPDTDGANTTSDESPPVVPTSLCHAVSAQTGISSLTMEPELYHCENLYPPLSSVGEDVPAATTTTTTTTIANSRSSPPSNDLPTLESLEQQVSEKLTKSTPPPPDVLNPVPNTDLADSPMNEPMPKIMELEPSFDPVAEIQPVPEANDIVNDTTFSLPGAYAQPATGLGGPNQTRATTTTTTTVATARQDQPILHTLAQACLVQENDNNLPVAQPEPQLNHHNKRGSRLSILPLAFLLLLLLLLLIGLALGIVWTTRNKDNESISTNASANAVQARKEAAFAIWNRIATTSQNDQWLQQDIISTLTLHHTTSLPNHLKALQWILFRDPMQLASDDDNLLQRFFLAHFYFSTTADGPWMACNPIDSFQLQDTNVTSELCHYNQFVGGGLFRGEGYGFVPIISPFEETFAARWLSASHECQWAGVFCNNNRQIQYLHLDNLNLTGTIAPEIHFLQDLSSLSLSDNQNLHGPIPTTLGQLPNLTYVDLSRNKFTGTIPKSWWNSNLEYLNLELTLMQVGSLPADIGNLTSLKYLFLGSTEVTGSLPKELYQLTNLAWLILQLNELTGSISTEIGRLTNMEFLSLQGNMLPSSMPSELGLLRNLIELDLRGLGLYGTIPEELYSGDLDKLNALILADNQLSGTVSSQIAALTSLSYIQFQINPNLVGTIPTELAFLPDLAWVQFQRTGMTGSVPEQLCKFRGDGYLQRVEVDCLAWEGNNYTPNLVCPEHCCTKCCHPTPKECRNM